MIYIHEIDNDGRGENTWEVSVDDTFLFSIEHFHQAMNTAMHLARSKATTVTIHPIEWHEKEHGNA